MANNTVTAPCKECIHDRVCKDKELMEEARQTLNNTFVKGNALAAHGKYELVDKLNRAGIKVKLNCDNYACKDGYDH